MEQIIYNIVLGMAFLISYSMPHMKSRQTMLWANVVSNVMFALYFFGMGEMAATLALLIAGTSSVLQALIPKDRMDETLRLRLMIATVMALASVYVTYHQPSDILPLAAIIIVRYSESFKDPQMIRIGNVLPTIMWIYFNYDVGLYLPMAGDAVLLLSYLWAIGRESKQRRALSQPAL